MTHMKIRPALFFLLMMTVSGAQEAQPHPYFPQWSRINHSVNFTALQIYRERAKAEGNILFSPLSVHTGFTMMWTGAGGDTREEMTRALHFTLQPWEDAEAISFGYNRLLNELGGDENRRVLRMDNTIWVREGVSLLPDFENRLREQFGSPPRTLDFQRNPAEARLQINRHAAEETGIDFQDLLAENRIGQDTGMILTTAISFQQAWSVPFPEASTRTAPFHLPGGETVQVNMMRKTGPFRGQTLEDGSEAVVIPFADASLTLLVIVPSEPEGDEDAEDPLSAWEASLPDVHAGVPAAEMHRFETLFQQAYEQKYEQTTVFLPRFRLQEEMDLAQFVKHPGMAMAFDPEKADFSEMTDDGGLHAGAAVHASTFTVNEAGSGIAEGNQVAVRALPVPADAPSHRVFRADRPFAFMVLHDRTGVILFFGRVVNPG